MALNFEDKKVIVSDVNEVAARSLSVIAAEYRGLTVSEMTELRKTARGSGVTLRVVRNTLAKRAFAETPYECMQDSLKGPLIFAFSHDDPGAAARVIRDFAKEHDALKVQVLSLDGQLLDGNQLNAVANLPTYDQAISQLMSVMIAPISKFVRTLAEPVAQVVRTVGAVRDKKQAE